MSLFQPGSTQARPVKAGSDRPDQPTPHRPGGVVRPDARAATPVLPGLQPASVADRIGRVVDGLGAFDEAGRMQLVRLLTDRIASRIADCRRQRVGTRPGQDDPAPGPTSENGEPDAGALLGRLAMELDGATALALLAGPGLEATGSDTRHLALSLLRHQSAGLQEAALDALFCSDVLQRFDRLCQSLCAGRLGDMPGRTDGEEHRPRPVFPTADAAALPAPQHQDADEAAFLDRVRCGDHRSAIGLLAAAALVPVESVETAILLRTRRGLVSLAWKAGYSMRAATLLQSQLAGIPPDTVLVASEDGSCPIGRSEMLWQIGFLARKLS